MTSKVQNRSNRRREVDTSDMEAFLATLDVGAKATLKVNGAQYMGAVVTVDLGQPLNPKRLTGEAEQELKARMRRLTRDLVGRDCSVAVDTDNYRGILWTAVKQ